MKKTLTNRRTRSCSNKSKWPLNGRCLHQNIMHYGQITRNQSHYQDSFYSNIGYNSFFTPNKAGFFEGNFFLVGQFDSPPFIVQEKLI